ncbi:MAG: isoprenyl transferase [Candidatus Hydrogenedentota bacterium]
MSEESWQKEIKPLLNKIDYTRLPQHTAIIMDGNGRWAKLRKKPRIFGHREGVKTVKKIVKTGKIIGLKYITLYAFSRENWQRPASEINALMRLLKEYLKREVQELDENNVRLNAIGRVNELPREIVKILYQSIDRLKKNTGPLLTLALNYGAKTEIVDACKKILQENKNIINKLDEDTFKRYLYTEDQPDVDLLIRTSGEYRISNFLLYQSAYAEIWITDTLWPDFTPQEFIQAILDYQKRVRRFGTV